MKILRVFTIILFLSLCVMSIEGLWEINDFLLLGLFVFWLLLDVVTYPKRNFLNSIIFITILFNVLGVFAIEHSESSYYLYEIEQWISYTGSIPVLFLFQSFFLLGIYLFIGENKIINFSVKNIQYKSIFLLLLYCLLIATYLLIIVHKPAPVLSVDRFVYDKEILGRFGQLTNVLFYFSFGLGILFFKEKNKLYLFLLFSIQLAFLLKGHKFWNLIEIFFLFFIPYVSYISRKKVIKVFFLLLIFLFILILTAININIYYFPSFEPMDYARQRLSQEGQLWWSTFLNYENVVRLSELIDEFKIYFSLNEYNQYDIGMYKVMQLNTTEERFEWKLERLSRFTYSTPALIYYYLGGYLGMFFMFICGVISGIWLRIVIYCMVYGDLVMSLLLARLFYILRKAVKDGDFYKFFSTEFILIFVTMFLLCFIHNRNSFFKNKELID